MRIYHGTMAVVPAGAGYAAVPVTDAPEGSETVTGWWIDLGDGSAFGSFESEADARGAAAETPWVDQVMAPLSWWRGAPKQPVESGPYNRIYETVSEIGESRGKALIAAVLAYIDANR